MSVHEERRKDGTVVFKVRWRQGGKNRSKAFNSAKLGGKRAARDAAREFDGQMARAQALGEAHDPDRGRITFSQAVDAWLEHADGHLADSTLDSYAVQLDLRLLPAFGDTPIRAIKTRDVQALVTRLRRQRVGDPTILRTLAVLQAILKRARIDGHIDHDPVADVDKPEQRRTRKPRAIEPVYIERMRHHLREQGHLGDAVLVCLLAYAGPTPEGEALPLTWASVRRRTLHIPGNLRHRQERFVPIVEPLARDLAEWRLACEPSEHGLVVPFARRAPGVAGGHVGPAGGPWTGEDWDNWRTRVFRPAAVAAGLPADTRPRDLRGSYATLLIYSGVKITEVAERMGNSPEVCLKHYGGIFKEYDPADTIDAAEAIQRARRAALFPPGSREEQAALAATG